jgi:hypothetical protein
MRLLFLVLVACTADVNPITLTLPERGANGLRCVETDPASEELIDRTPVLADGAHLTVVLDYLSFEGLPSCRPLDLLRWCEDRTCPIVRRNCREVVVPPPFMVPANELQAKLMDAIAAGGPLTADAPDGVVVLRVTFTRETCDALAAVESPYTKPRCADLIGCVYSCPVQLDEVEGEVLLELDSLGTICNEETVGVCAGIGHDAMQTCTR